MTELAKIENNVITQESAMLQVIERASTNPEVDIDKMERLLQMQITMCDRQAVQAWSTAMVATQSQIPPIKATKKNPQTNSMFADLKHILAVITPIYTANGFSMSFGEGEANENGMIPIQCDVSHIGGYSKQYKYDSPIDDEGIKGNKNKTATHGKASAVSYGRRYLTLMIFNLTIIGEDDDGNLGDTRSAKDIDEGWIAHNIAVRDLFPSIEAMKHAIAMEDYDVLAEVWFELTDAEKDVVCNPAPTKGGILTTIERAALKCDEFAIARGDYYKAKKDSE